MNLLLGLAAMLAPGLALCWEFGRGKTQIALVEGQRKDKDDSYGIAVGIPYPTGEKQANCGG